MIKKRGIFIVLLVIIATLISLYFDSWIVQALSSIRNSFLNELLIGITFVSSIIIIFFILPSAFLGKTNKKKIILPLWITLAVSGILSFLLKIIIQRQRPFQLAIVSTWPILANNSHFVWNYSFPSFQTMAVFCTLPILSKEFPKLKYIWIAFAILIAFSRVYFGLHFLSDVLVSGLIGYLLGMVIISQKEKINKLFLKIDKKILG